MNAITRILSVVLLGVAGPGAALAQAGPAEYPPSSFKGSQYVDSKGCVYIRAGVDGAVQWVPRMARNRTAVCGFQPTRIAGATSDPTPVDRSGVTVITAAVPEAGGASTAAPTVRTQAPVVRSTTSVRATAPRPAPRVASAPVVIRPAQPVTGPNVRTYAATTPSYAAPSAPVIEAQPRIVAPSAAPRVTAGVSTSCGSLSAAGQQYMGFGGVGGVRCGPQSDYVPYIPEGGQPAPRFAASPSYNAPVYGDARGVPNYGAPVPRATSSAPRLFGTRQPTVQRVVTARTTATAAISPQARVMPRPAYENRVQAQGVQVPQGYRPIWEDDRLNPRRAEQTLAGKRQMEQVWTKDLPRRLVPVTVAPQGYTVQSGASYTAPNTGARIYGVPDYSNPRATVSSRGVAARQVAQQRVVAPRAGTYIQVGSYRTPGNAQAVAQRLSGSGLQVSLRGAGTSQVVMIGPFGSDRDIDAALRIARGAGFSDAFPRR